MLYLPRAAGKLCGDVFGGFLLKAALGAFQVPQAGLTVQSRLVDDIIGVLGIIRIGMAAAFFDFFILFCAAIVAGVGLYAVRQVRRLGGDHAAIPPVAGCVCIGAVRTGYPMIAVIDTLIAQVLMISASAQLILPEPLGAVGADQNGGFIAGAAADQGFPRAEIAGNVFENGIECRIAVYQQTERLLRYLRAVGALPVIKSLARELIFLKAYGQNRIVRRGAVKVIGTVRIGNGSPVGDNRVLRCGGAVRRGKHANRQNAQQQHCRQSETQQSFGYAFPLFPHLTNLPHLFRTIIDQLFEFVYDGVVFLFSFQGQLIRADGKFIRDIPNFIIGKIYAHRAVLDFVAEFVSALGKLQCSAALTVKHINGGAVQIPFSAKRIRSASGASSDNEDDPDDQNDQSG